MLKEVFSLFSNCLNHLLILKLKLKDNKEKKY